MCGGEIGIFFAIPYFTYDLPIAAVVLDLSRSFSSSSTANTKGASI